MRTAGQCIARAVPRRPRRIAPARAAAAAVVLVLLAACGQRGPLYLPDSQPKKKLAVNPEAFAAVATPRH